MVGLIAVGGPRHKPVSWPMVHLDRAYRDALEQGRLRSGQDMDTAMIDGALKCQRSMLMTVVTTTSGLMSLLWKSNVGADMSVRIAKPVVGGMWLCMFLTLLGTVGGRCHLVSLAVQRLHAPSRRPQSRCLIAAESA